VQDLIKVYLEKRKVHAKVQAKNSSKSSSKGKSEQDLVASISAKMDYQ